MFWKKRINEIKSDNNDFVKEKHFPYPFRNCWIYISEKYNEILFVPFGKINNWRSCELEKVIVCEWPLKIRELQKNIEDTLNNFEYSVEDITPNNENWHSFNKSKAKSQHSFKVDYVAITIETDLERGYGEGEVERIIVKASPKDWQKDNYKIVGKDHLLETHVAQVILDIYNACKKIRT